MIKKKKQNENKIKIAEIIVFAVLVFFLCFLFIKGTFFEPRKKIVKNLESSQITVTYGEDNNEKNYKDSDIYEDLIADVIDELYLEESIEEYNISNLIENGVSFDIKPQTLTNMYDLYEEDLPYAIEEDYEPREPLNIEVTQKPPYFGDKPVIAIVIDDMGISPKRTKDINSLHAPITSSFLTYAKNLDKQIQDSKNAGHDIIVHIPMEAKTKQDVAPDVLTTEMSKEEVETRLVNMLKSFNGIKGINNHMGSKFTENAQSLEYVMTVLKEKEMFFLDSKTSPDSKVKEVAFKYNVAYAGRNVFLDNNNNYEYIMGQLKQVERVAEKNGFAIAIGHPKSQTYLALKDWIPTLEEKGIGLIKLSEVIKILNPEYND